MKPFSSTILRLLFAVMTLSACASKEISSAAAGVQVHKQGSTLLADCRKLAPVQGQGSKPFGNAIPSRGALTNAVSELREATALIGGDSVAIVNQEESVSSIRVLGTAYKCF